MPRQSPYTILLSDEEHKELAALAGKYTDPHVKLFGRSSFCTQPTAGESQSWRILCSAARPRRESSSIVRLAEVLRGAYRSTRLGILECRSRRPPDSDDEADEFEEA